MKAVEKYYDRNVREEWQRLEHYRLEFAATLRHLEDFLAAPGRVLDVGGGPGRYAMALARRGHRVTLFDISSASLEFARQKAKSEGVALDDVIHGDARDMSGLEDDSFDDVLCMGPLYHLRRETDRRRVVAECRRVLKPAGLLFSTFLNRSAPIVYTLKECPELIPADLRFFQEILTAGLPLGKKKPPFDFPGAFYSEPVRIGPFLESCGLETLRLAAVEGLAGAGEDRLRHLPEALFQRWVDLVHHTATNPAAWGCSEHLLHVGRKSG